MMALHCNLNRDAKKQPEPFAALDFMNFTDKQKEPERELTPDELDAYAREIFGV